MMTTLANIFTTPISPDGFLSAFYWWQIPMLILAIVITVLYIRWKRKQV